MCLRLNKHINYSLFNNRNTDYIAFLVFALPYKASSNKNLHQIHKHRKYIIEKECNSLSYDTYLYHSNGKGTVLICQREWASNVHSNGGKSNSYETCKVCVDNIEKFVACIKPLGG